VLEYLDILMVYFRLLLLLAEVEVVEDKQLLLVEVMEDEHLVEGATLAAAIPILDKIPMLIPILAGAMLAAAIPILDKIPMLVRILVGTMMEGAILILDKIPIQGVLVPLVVRLL
jgi:hypothetical protein